jgi:exodeoxyribonuclease V beta subunit
MPQTFCQPKQPDTFDLARSPLGGFNLIDASAGTGKTYTICGLVIRLLLEKNLTIEQILVVTYTDAATEDLRDRIRQKLRQALHAIKNPPSDDEFLRNYLVKIKDYNVAALRLSEALRSFDEAAIFTIHGFCQRMLLENSFESNILFDTELVADDSYLIKEIIEDFWRQTFSQSSELFSQYAAAKLTPDALHDFLSIFIPHPFVHFIPAIDLASGYNLLSDSEAEYIEVFRKVCREWIAAREEVSNDLLNSQALKRNIYKKAGIPGLIDSMDEMAASDTITPQLFKKFILLTSSKITGATKIKQTPNILPFYELCENLMLASNKLLTQYDRCLLALKKRLLDSFRYDLKLRKERDNVFSFDDLLQRLHEALTGPESSSFARLIAEKYPAALIDEFQDTDPLQFHIFTSIYKKESLLFLIGDPKQAIYSFRGADIFTYMDAAVSKHLDHHTLGVNHRSTPELVKAVNTIFCEAQKPFVFDAISFQEVSAAQKNNPEYLTIDGQQEEPFILWYFDRDIAAEENTSSSQEINSPIPKTIARRHIISRVAAEVCRLLNLASENRVHINNRKLIPGDIAILVRKNDEARKMQQALTDLHVPSVLHSGDDLFSTEEAIEMSLLLGAIAMPKSIRRIKTALLTRFINLQQDTFNLLQNNSHESDSITEGWLTKFRFYHELWDRHDFIQMFWTVMSENNVRQRLLASVNGERSLTNILHLAEILHHEAVNQGLNITALLGYLHDRLAGEQKKNIEHQLRLESDEDRVKIVTIHKAKGLEYPVVFSPFSWEGSRLNPKRGCLFHLQKNDHKTELTFDAGSEELHLHQQRALHEEMAENLRLLYVALTRAVHRCYLVWGPFKSAETSAPAYLLHQGPKRFAGPELSSEDANTFMRNIADRFLGLSDHEILTDLQNLSTASKGTIRLSTVKTLPETNMLDMETRTIPLRHREFAGNIISDWTTCSFSSLTANRSAIKHASQTFEDSSIDRDSIPIVQSLSAEKTDLPEHTYDIFSFPHGARPGTLLHEILEQADFTKEIPVMEHLINEKLQRFAYDTTWYPIIAEMLKNLSNVSLHKDIPGLKLSNIPIANCLHELEFYFPLSRITPADVKSIFGSDKHISANEIPTSLDLQLDRLTFAPARGFMKGFIDLVFEFENKFYLIDWKSNYLGSNIENYNKDKLFESILSGYYFLQYHIYTLALHLYLKKSIPGYEYAAHFGGVFYIFLRGVNQKFGPGYGIYYDLPDTSLIEKLNEKFVAN